MTISDFVCIIVALVTIVGALGVISFKNIIYSALSLVLTFLGVAAIYFQLNAGFVGAIQILVYAGAISVLIIFAIMLVMDKDIKKTNLFNKNISTSIWGFCLSLLLAAGLGASIWFTDWKVTTGKLPGEEVSVIGNLFMNDYVIAFETAALLLLVAVVGAILLAKGAEEK